MRKALALAACMVTVAAACGSSDGDSGGTASTDATEVTEAPPAETDPVETAPADTEPSAPEPEPEPTTAPEPEPETTTTTEPAPEINAVGLVPLPGAQLDFSANQIDVPTLVWSLFSGSGGIVVEDVVGPIPAGCHGTSFFNPETFELLQISDADAEAYASVGVGGCDAMEGVADGVIDGAAVAANAPTLIQFDFGALPPLPFEVSNQIVNPDGGDGIFRSADETDPVVINDLLDATHAVGVSGVFEVDPDDRTLSRLDLPATTPGPGCDGSEALCLDDRFQIGIVDQNGGPASVMVSGDNGGRFYFFGAHDANILVSVLNGCALNSNFWVFAAANTDVAFDLTVTDTTTGASQTFSNPLDPTPEAILDTSAFATCP